jgi:UDPglucose--hexose-1-phosphate uridylyltransferase
MPELRRDPLSGRWVVIATERAKRPQEYAQPQPPLVAALCPFCPGQEHHTPPAIRVYGEPPGWSARVIPNKFPALRVEPALERSADGIYDGMAGVGAHEVIIESARHVESMSQMSAAELEQMLIIWQERVADLRRDGRLRCAMVFKNQGALSGASLAHVHSQLIALPLVPPRLQGELDHTRAHWAQHERCALCDIIAQEEREGVRVIDADAHTITLSPWASQGPFEVWIAPRAHADTFEAAPAHVIHAAALALAKITRRLDLALDNPALNLWLMSAPYGPAPLLHYHWRLVLLPALQRFAGFEWSSGCTINPTPPEVATRHLRDIDTTGMYHGTVPTDQDPSPQA